MSMSVSNLSDSFIQTLSEILDAGRPIREQDVKIVANVMKQFSSFAMDKSDIKKFFYGARVYFVFLNRYAEQPDETNCRQHVTVRMALRVFLFVVDNTRIFDGIAGMFTKLVDAILENFSPHGCVKEYLRVYLHILDKVSDEVLRGLAAKYRSFKTFYTVVKNTADVEMQAIVIEIIFKLFKFHNIQDIKEVFPEIVQVADVSSVDMNNIYHSIRMIINKLNETSGNIFSINCSAMELDSQKVVEFEMATTINDTWLDFNLLQEKLSFFCAKSFLSSLGNFNVYSDTTWEVLSFSAKDVLKTDFNYNTFTENLEISMEIKTSSFEFVTNVNFDTIRNLDISVSRYSDRFDKLVKVVLPKMFEYTFSEENFTETPSGSAVPVNSKKISTLNVALINSEDEENSGEIRKRRKIHKPEKEATENQKPKGMSLTSTPRLVAEPQNQKAKRMSSFKERDFADMSLTPSPIFKLQNEKAERRSSIKETQLADMPLTPPPLSPESQENNVLRAAEPQNQTTKRMSSFKERDSADMLFTPSPIFELQNEKAKRRSSIKERQLADMSLTPPPLSPESQENNVLRAAEPQNQTTKRMSFFKERDSADMLLTPSPIFEVHNEKAKRRSSIKERQWADMSLTPPPLSPELQETNVSQAAEPQNQKAKGMSSLEERHSADMSLTPSLIFELQNEKAKTRSSIKERHTADMSLTSSPLSPISQETNVLEAAEPQNEKAKKMSSFKERQSGDMSLTPPPLSPELQAAEPQNQKANRRSSFKERPSADMSLTPSPSLPESHESYVLQAAEPQKRWSSFNERQLEAMFSTPPLVTPDVDEAVVLQEEEATTNGKIKTKSRKRTDIDLLNKSVTSVSFTEVVAAPKCSKKISKFFSSGEKATPYNKRATKLTSGRVQKKSNSSKKKNRRTRRKIHLDEIVKQKKPKNNFETTSCSSTSKVEEWLKNVDCNVIPGDEIQIDQTEISVLEETEALPRVEKSPEKLPEPVLEKEITVNGKNVEGTNNDIKETVELPNSPKIQNYLEQKSITNMDREIFCEMEKGAKSKSVSTLIEKENIEVEHLVNELRSDMEQQKEIESNIEIENNIFKDSEALTKNCPVNKGNSYFEENKNNLENDMLFSKSLSSLDSDNSDLPLLLLKNKWLKTTNKQFNNGAILNVNRNDEPQRCDNKKINVDNTETSDTIEQKQHRLNRNSKNEDIFQKNIEDTTFASKDKKVKSEKAKRVLYNPNDHSHLQLTITKNYLESKSNDAEVLVRKTPVRSKPKKVKPENKTLRNRHKLTKEDIFGPKKNDKEQASVSTPYKSTFSREVKKYKAKNCLRLGEALFNYSRERCAMKRGNDTASRRDDRSNKETKINIISNVLIRQATSGEAPYQRSYPQDNTGHHCCPDLVRMTNRSYLDFIQHVQGCNPELLKSEECCAISNILKNIGV